MGNGNIVKFARKHGYTADFRETRKRNDWKRERRAERRAKANRNAYAA